MNKLTSPIFPTSIDKDGGIFIKSLLEYCNKLNRTINEMQDKITKLEAKP